VPFYHVCYHCSYDSNAFSNLSQMYFAKIKVSHSSILLYLDDKNKSLFKLNSVSYAHTKKIPCQCMITSSLVAFLTKFSVVVVS